MKTDKTIRLQIKAQLTGPGEAPPLQAYAFNAQGELLGSAVLEKGAASIDLPAELSGQMVQTFLGPQLDKGETAPSAAALQRMGAYARPTRLLSERPLLELQVPIAVFPSWCLCVVRGRLVKRFTLPDGTVKTLPVCHARVHVCEVDAIRIVIDRIPDRDILKLRDDLLDKLRQVPWPPIPIPDPGPLTGLLPGPRPGPLGVRSALPTATMLNARAAQPQVMEFAASALASAGSVQQARAQLRELSQLIAIHLCDLIYFWRYFRVNCFRVIEVDSEGRFSALFFYDCKDQPDLYFWVEQFQDGAWQTVYRPSIGCGTYWNYTCGSEVVLYLPRAVACDEPPYGLPPDVTLFVLPWSIANAPIWSIPPGAPAAPIGWVRPDGLIDYDSGSSLGMLYNAPFGGTLNFLHDDSYFIPSSGIKYYRYAYRRVSGTPNTGAADPGWTPIIAPQSRGYRLEYSGGRLPTYESYSVGPKTVGANTGLFEFKPQQSPNPGGTVTASEWLSGNVSEVAASWNTVLAAPPLSADNATDDAGVFEVKLEVFDPAGNQVMPGASTFQFLARNADGTTTRLSTAAEIAGGAYVLKVHVDNNGTEAALPQPSIGGVAASDDCGFLRYAPGDLVHVQYVAAHPNDHAVFRFGITRGSHGMPTASTLAPYVEVAAPTAPTTSAPYVKAAGSYQRDFTPVELVGTCVNAAFAASLGVYGKATNGYTRLGLDASRLIAFALAEKPPGP